MITVMLLTRTNLRWFIVLQLILCCLWCQGSVPGV
jgi:hypothetical protein